MTLATSAPVATPATNKPELLAQLPAQLLHIASQFASKDEAKQALTVINVKCIEETRSLPAHIRIASTNGHYAFRCRLFVPNGDFTHTPAPWFSAVPELSITADSFRKRPAYAQQALIYSEGEARLLGSKKGQAMGLLEVRPIGNPVDPYMMAFPPGFDELWPNPELMGNEPKTPIGWNGDYMATICKIAGKYSDNACIKFHCGKAPHTPLYLECETEEAKYRDSELPGKLEFLLMPVQIRR